MDDAALVIEVNDSPDLDAGIEDKVAKDALWRTLIQDVIRGIEAGRRDPAYPASRVARRSSQVPSQSPES